MFSSVAILADVTVVAGSDDFPVEAWSLLPGNLPKESNVPPSRDVERLARPRRRVRAGDVTRSARNVVSAGGVVRRRVGNDSTIRIPVIHSTTDGDPACNARHAHLGPVHGLAASADGAASVGEDDVACGAPPVGARGSLGNDDDSVPSRKHSSTRRRRRWRNARARTSAPVLAARSASSGARASARSRWGLRAVTLPFWNGWNPSGIHPDGGENGRAAGGGSAALRTRGVVHACRRRPRPRVHPASRRLASCGDDGFVCVHVGELPATTRWRPHGGEHARCVIWGEDGSALRSGGWDGTVRSVDGGSEGGWFDSRRVRVAGEWAPEEAFATRYELLRL